MRLSPDHYPEQVDCYCAYCELDYFEVKVDHIEGDHVAVVCPGCSDPVYVRVIE